MRKSTALLLTAGAALGAGLTYLLDPQQGRRRRALSRDKLAHYGRRGGRALRAVGRDVANRARGRALEARRRMEGERIPDGVLVDRVRSEMGHVIEEPSAVRVTAAGGHVTLTGPVQPDEVSRLIARVAAVRGVAGVENRLETGGAQPAVH